MSLPRLIDDPPVVAPAGSRNFTKALVNLITSPPSNAMDEATNTSIDAQPSAVGVGAEFARRAIAQRPSQLGEDGATTESPDAPRSPVKARAVRPSPTELDQQIDGGGSVTQSSPDNTSPVADRVRHTARTSHSGFHVNFSVIPPPVRSPASPSDAKSPRSVASSNAATTPGLPAWTPGAVAMRSLQGQGLQHEEAATEDYYLTVGSQPDALSSVLGANDHNEVVVEGVRYCMPSLFGVVEDGVYRCGYPTPDTFPFLRQLRLKTVINLLDKLPDEYADFLKEQGTRYVHSAVKGNKAHCEEMDRTKVAKALELIMDRSNHPVLIHCRSGKHRTGALIGCLRMLERWSLEDACDEYVYYCKHKQRYVDKQYIERFDPRTLASYLPPVDRLASFLPEDCTTHCSALEDAIIRGEVDPAEAEIGLAVSAITKGPDEPGVSYKPFIRAMAAAAQASSMAMGTSPHQPSSSSSSATTMMRSTPVNMPVAPGSVDLYSNNTGRGGGLIAIGSLSSSPPTSVQWGSASRDITEDDTAAAASTVSGPGYRHNVDRDHTSIPSDSVFVVSNHAGGSDAAAAATTGTATPASYLAFLRSGDGHSLDSASGSPVLQGIPSTFGGLAASGAVGSAASDGSGVSQSLHAIAALSLNESSSQVSTSTIDNAFRPGGHYTSTDAATVPSDAIADRAPADSGHHPANLRNNPLQTPVKQSTTVGNSAYALYGLLSASSAASSAAADSTPDGAAAAGDGAYRFRYPASASAVAAVGGGASDGPTLQLQAGGVSAHLPHHHRAGGFWSRDGTGGTAFGSGGSRAGSNTSTPLSGSPQPPGGLYGYGSGSVSEQNSSIGSAGAVVRTVAGLHTYVGGASARLISASSSATVGRSTFASSDALASMLSRPTFVPGSSNLIAQLHRNAEANRMNTRGSHHHASILPGRGPGGASLFTPPAATAGAGGAATAGGSNPSSPSLTAAATASSPFKGPATSSAPPPSAFSLPTQQAAAGGGSTGSSTAGTSPPQQQQRGSANSSPRMVPVTSVTLPSLPTLFSPVGGSKNVLFAGRMSPINVSNTATNSNASGALATAPVLPAVIEGSADSGGIGLETAFSPSSAGAAGATNQQGLRTSSAASLASRSRPGSASSSSINEATASSISAKPRSRTASNASAKSVGKQLLAASSPS